MVGIFTRIRNYFSSEVNAALDNAEDPMKLYELQMTKLVDQMSKVEREAAMVIANRATMSQKIKNAEGEIAKYQNLAKSAGKNKDEDAVRAFLIKMHSVEDEKKRYEELYQSLDASAQKAETVYRALRLRVEDLNAKRSVYRAKLMAADAQESINKITSQYSADGASVDAITDTIDKKLLAAEAVSELRDNDKDEDLKQLELMYSGSEEDLENEVASYLNGYEEE